MSVLLGTAALWLLAGGAVAQTRMIFPRIVMQEGRFSGIAIANPGGQSAEVQLQAYRVDGSTFLGPVMLTVPAGSQVARLASELFTSPGDAPSGPDSVFLWVEATSSGDGLTGFYLEGSDKLEHMDGSSLAGRGTDLVIPFVEATGSSTTDLSLVNPDPDDAAALTLELLRSDGSVAASASDVPVPRRGALQGPLQNFLNGDLAAAAALRVHSSLPVVCYVSVHRQPDDSLVTVSAQSAALAAKSLFFPQLAQGDAWETTVGLVNSSSSPVLVAITACRGDGSLFSAPTVTANPAVRLLQPGASMRESLAALFGFAPGPLQSGWIRADGGTAALHGYVEYGAGTNRALVPGQADGYSRAIFSHQALQPPYFTGLALLNTGGLIANAEVTSLNADGSVVGKAQRTLKPGQRESLLVQQWVPAAAGVSGGAVFVKSDTPLMTTQLFGTDSLSALANVPPQGVPATFDPGASIPGVKVTPPLAVLETGKTMQFSSTGAGGVEWSVNGVKGGAGGTGTITQGGAFTAPAVAPANSTLTVEASTAGGSQSGGSTVDIVRRETLTSGLSLVTAVAYVENLARFFVAEQQALASAPAGSADRRAAAATKIYEQATTGPLSLFAEVPGDSVEKMLPFTDAGLESYLLLAGRDTGRIYRLSLATRSLATVATGLHNPVSLAFDSLSGDLLVADEDGISVIPRSQFDPGASAPDAAVEGVRAHLPQKRVIAIARAQGVASNGCNGAVYAVTAAGNLIEYLGSRERTLLSGLEDPRQILVLYRNAPSCAESLTLVVVEANRAALIFPLSRAAITLLGDFSGARDLTFFPRTRPFGGTAEPSIALAERQPGSGASRVIRLRVGSSYGNVPPGPVTASEAGVSARDPLGDTFETSATEQAGLSRPDIESVKAVIAGGSVILSLTFGQAVAPFRAGRPNSLSGFIEFDYQPGGVAPRSAAYNLFATPSDIGIDAYIDLARELLVTAAGESFPMPVKYLGEIVAVKLPPSLPDPTKVRCAVVVGNRLEATDVFPNLGAARLTR